MPRMRAIVLLALGCVGCVGFPRAGLLQSTARLEVVQGPVVCGPVGFRTVPLQSRWGEYVRVTVTAPGSLSGSVLVHANGVAQTPRPWSSESVGALVVEARFANEDVDARFALERDRPIDITLTGLAGMCEGAVFTVEQGALVPSIDERAWIVELERRGGPALAARREWARAEAEERRQAHYAQWAVRAQVQVSAEVRQAHYAHWEARRSSVTPVEGETVFAAASDPSTALGVNGGVVSMPGEWSQPADNSLRVSVEASWAQPFAPRLETVAVSSQSQVATRASEPSAAVVEVTGYVEPATELVIAPAVFQFLLHLGAAVSAPAPVHAARPIR